MQKATLAHSFAHVLKDVLADSLARESSKRKKLSATDLLRPARPQTQSLYDVSLEGWSVSDVICVHNDLYPRETLHVLERAVHDMDSSIGINWDVLEAQARWLYPRRRCAVVRALDEKGRGPHGRTRPVRWRNLRSA